MYIGNYLACIFNSKLNTLLIINKQLAMLETKRFVIQISPSPYTLKREIINIFSLQSAYRGISILGKKNKNNKIKDNSLFQLVFIFEKAKG